jgi:F-type H+-transporting ATPase subunit delta
VPSAVSNRYATALADTIASPGAGKPATDPQAVVSQLAEFNKFFSESSELRIVFSTPAVSADKKKAILAQVTAGMGFDPVTVNFLSVVIDHERMALLGEIAEAFQAILHERMGITVAEITTARPLEEAEKAALAGALGAKTGRQVRMNFSLDPNLIGGVVARIGSTIYDGSVRGSLVRLRGELAGE